MLGDMREKRWLLYGASGYTGRLVSDECARQGGLAPTLGGRDEVRLRALAEARGWPHLAVNLDDTGALAAALHDFAVVLHCAGPFSATSAPMRAACLASGTHYLDITGEIDVFVEAHAQHAAAQAAGVVLCPGVGFDVVPTDCVAACLKEALPDATALVLGFSGVDRLSAGTTVTAMEAVFRGCAHRRERRRCGRQAAPPTSDADRNRPSSFRGVMWRQRTSRPALQTSRSTCRPVRRVHARFVRCCARSRLGRRRRSA